MKRIISVLVVVLLCMVSLISGYAIAEKRLEATPGKLNETDFESIERAIREVDGYITQNFYEDVDQEKLLVGMLKGMTIMLNDPYSNYYTKEEYQRVVDETSGSYAGIGVLMGLNDERQVEIKDVYDGGSAKEKGVQVGDIITEVEGEKIEISETMLLTDVTSRVKGEVGTSVNLTFQRGSETFGLELERRKILLHYVESRMLDDEIGYIKLKEFSGECAQEFADAGNALASKGAKSLVIDLRGNPGGFVRDAVSIADMLLPEGVIVTTKDRNGKGETYESDADSAEMELVVLVDGNTASASEILAGALQDHKKATLVGTQTYGKGIVQKPFTINSTGGTLMLTVMTYYTPNGRSIHGEGIEPDHVVELPAEVDEDLTNLTDANDTQLKKALELLRPQAQPDATAQPDASAQPSESLQPAA